MKYHILDFWDTQNPENKKEFCDTVEKGLGPRPLGPTGPIFQEGPVFIRTMTVTGEVQIIFRLEARLSVA